jgi:predicted RNA binding protein YcfA (HicA-like mRNA interferase family)
VPRKLRQLISDLKRAGFIDRGGKGSHRNFVHPKGLRVTLSGNERADAKRYQEREIAQALNELKHS